MLKWSGWKDCLASEQQGGELITAIILPQNMLSRCCPVLQSPALFSFSYKGEAVLTFPIFNLPLLLGWGSCNFNTLYLSQQETKTGPLDVGFVVNS